MDCSVRKPRFCLKDSKYRSISLVAPVEWLCVPFTRTEGRNLRVTQRLSRMRSRKYRPSQQKRPIRKLKLEIHQTVFLTIKVKFWSIGISQSPLSGSKKSYRSHSTEAKIREVAYHPYHSLLATILRKEVLVEDLAWRVLAKTRRSAVIVVITVVYQISI